MENKRNCYKNILWKILETAVKQSLQNIINFYKLLLWKILETAIKTYYGKYNKLLYKLIIVKY